MMSMVEVRESDTAVDAPQWTPSIPPIWKEFLWTLDWTVLRFHPVYYGIDVPRGDGSPVVLVPGFLGTDSYLYELYFWLRRIGYRPYMSGIGLNAECPGALARKLFKTVRRANEETGRPVRVVGHSLGGIIGRRVCLEHPDIARQLVYLGSPVQSVQAHPLIVASAALLHTTLSLVNAQHGDCLTAKCPCGFVTDIDKDLDSNVRHAAIYTRADGVVDWHTAQEDDPHLNFEVGGTHIGLVYNPLAYQVLAELLFESKD
jgi:pimeloyl-ACP methyl ester carboxylesterase